MNACPCILLLPVIVAGTLFESSKVRAERAAHPAHQVSEASSLPKKHQVDLESIVREAFGGFEPVASADVEATRERLRQSLLDLSMYLDRRGPHGEQWRRYLKLHDLQRQLDNDMVDVETLEAVGAQYLGDYPGLELPPICAVRRALSAYVRRLNDAHDGQLAEQYDAHLQTLLLALENQQFTATQQREMIGGELGWFLEHEQAPHMTAEIRRRYGLPNLYIGVSEEFVNEAVARAIEETLPINQSLGRTTIRGAARVQGTVQARFHESNERAEIHVVFRGKMNASMTGTRGPVEVGASGDATIAASKLIRLTDSGITPQPADTNVDLRTRFTGASTRFRRPRIDRAVRRFALRVAERQRGSANAQAQQEARRLMNQRFDEEVHTLAADFQETFLNRYRRPLLRRDAFPETFEMRTTNQLLCLKVLQAAGNQLGAPAEPPSTLDDVDVSVQFHESLLENLAATMLAGRTLSESEMEQMLRDLTGSPGGTDKQAARNEDEVAITFDDRCPLALQMDDGIVAITLRGSRFISGARAYPAMNITLRYRLQRVGEGYLAEIVDEPEIVPPRFATEPGPHRYSGREAALRRLLSNRLDKVLDKSLHGERLALPRPFGEVSELQFRQLDARNGWLTAGLALPTSAPSQATVAADVR